MTCRVSKLRIWEKVGNLVGPHSLFHILPRTFSFSPMKICPALLIQSKFLQYKAKSRGKWDHFFCHFPPEMLNGSWIVWKLAPVSVKTGWNLYERQSGFVRVVHELWPNFQETWSKSWFALQHETRWISHGFRFRPKKFGLAL